jgi:8-oxo-dGTP pyrophosphatase MutT (NUDIX family)
MDAADDGPLTTAAGELKEETGCSGGSFRLLASLPPNPATHTNRVHVVLAQAVVHTGSATPDVTENIEVIRVKAAEAAALALRGDMTHAQHVGLLMIGLKAANVI